MRPLVIATALAALVGAGNAAADSVDLKPYKSEAGAQQHCPTDVVVWGSVATGAFFFKDNRHYGKTPGGGYMCKKEAEAAGLEAGGGNASTHF